MAAGDAVAVIGPSLSTVALAVQPIYAEAGLAVVAPNIGTDETAGIFRLNLGQSGVGEAMADYLHHALAGRRAAVIHSDDGLGRPLARGFRRGAERLGIAVSYHPVSGPEQAAAAARRVAGDPARPAVVLGMLETAAVPVLRVLRRADVPGPFLATASFAYGGYARLFAAEPEERDAPGFFTDGLYAASPVLFDSGSAALLAFGERFRARHGHEPSWRVVLAYDATRMLLGAVASAPPVRAAARRAGGRHPGAPPGGARGRRRAGRPGAGLRRPERADLVRPGARPSGGRPDGPLRPRPARIGAAATRARGEPRPGRAHRRDGVPRRGGALCPPPAGGLHRHPPQRDLQGRFAAVELRRGLLPLAPRRRPAGRGGPGRDRVPGHAPRQLRSGAAGGPPRPAGRLGVPPLARARRVPQRVRPAPLPVRPANPGAALVQYARRLGPDRLRPRPARGGDARRPAFSRPRRPSCRRPTPASCGSAPARSTA